MRSDPHFRNNYYYQDASGSTSHVAGSNGALKEYYLYDLQGKPSFFSATGVSQADTMIGVRHLFTGQQWYNELALYDLRNRYYSPDVGRFLQADPASFGGDPSNLYRYCGNNPLKWSDPNGQWEIPVVQSNGNSTTNQPTVIVNGTDPSVFGTNLGNGATSYTSGSPFTGVTYSPGSNPFSGIGPNPFGPAPFTIQTGVAQPGLASVPAVNPTTPYTQNAPSQPSLLPHSSGPLIDFHGAFGIVNGVAGNTTVAVAGYTPTTGGTNWDAWQSSGSVIGGPNAPDPNANGTTVVVGASAGFSVGGWFSNAERQSQLLGPFSTFAINTPIGSLSASGANGIYVIGLSVGPSVGYSATYYPTTTINYSDGCP